MYIVESGDFSCQDLIESNCFLPMQLSANSSYIFPNKSLSKWLVLHHLTHASVCWCVMLQKGTAGAGRASGRCCGSGTCTCRPSCGRRRASSTRRRPPPRRSSTASPRTPPTSRRSSARRYGAVLQAHHQPQPLPIPSLVHSSEFNL